MPGAPTSAPDPARARRRLVALLRLAHAGELAAALAYRGHWRSLADPAESARVRAIEEEEWHHRSLVHGLLSELGHAPGRLREARQLLVGRTLGLLCRFSGWFLPMYAAGLLERKNVVEYEQAALLARASGREDFLPCLLQMADVEREHERYFRERALSHRLARWLPLWSAPPARAITRPAASPAPERTGSRACS